jgi:hypothetical protein
MEYPHNMEFILSIFLNLSNIDNYASFFGMLPASEMRLPTVEGKMG